MEIQTFNFDTLPVRIVILDGEPWFVAVDVALILGLGNPRSSLAVLDDDEKGVHSMDTPGGNQALTIISESGLYSLILRSRKDEARPFRKWVTAQVLPTIRKSGGYTVGEQALPQSLPEALRLAADLAEQGERLAAENALLAPKAQVYDALISADGTYAVGDAAKILGTGEVRLFAQLRQRNILMDRHRSGSEHHNLPYQQYIERGYFTVITRPRPNSDNGKVSQTTRITAKGLAWLQKGLQQQNLLLAERTA
ncbi:phage antirepressor KilAC domain-containing protein [Deinococcus sp. SM5_A1]|uniref:phage antirepressor KilAC domain-containing protein n=1 Tax=Deinococcus sp. SM5_A1 TaxID=3379094 RepID=UPI003858136B